ncbi:MAG: hypothetical protein JWO56_123, partial [Acidobacteria bacterium]|nr:hypothetical protein [Acidobacteriota bacterium]
EFIDGTTVRQWSAAFGQFPLALAADVAVQTLAGLDHIHRRGLLHRDISSDNVMLSYDADGRLVAKIIDLGIAKDVNTASADTTQAGMLIGNPKYMSPEQLGGLADGEQLDGRADLYCLGVVLYEMLLGVPPFASETPQGYIAKHLMQEPPPFAKAKPGLRWAEGLEAVIFRTLEKDRRRRFADARELSRALSGFLGAEAGTLTNDDVVRLRRGPDATMIQALAPALRGADMPTEITPASVVRDDTLEKAQLFELSLVESVHEREQAGDRGAVQRLAEAHPASSAVGKAAREALTRMRSAEADDREVERSFQAAWEDGSPAALRGFIEAHRSSPRAAKAQELLNEATAFEGASRAESDTGLREFLKAWPDGRHHLEAEIRLVALKQQLAEKAHAAAIAADTYVAFRDFLARFPAAAQSDAARHALAERLAFETAAAAESEDAWDDYLAKWNDDPHAPAARGLRNAIAAREEEAFRAAASEKTAAAWEAFLERYGDGRRGARAERNRREALAFEHAREEGRAALDAFVRAHSDGLLIKDARRLLRHLADTDDFVHARSLDKAAAWQLYLTSHPAGAHVGEARARLTAIEDAAFAALMASKSPAAGTAFLNDFPDSPRRQQVLRLIEKQAEGKAVQAALDAIARDDITAAESLLAKIADPERRSEVAAALDNLRERRATEERRRLARAAEQQRESEPHDWDAAWEAGGVEAWDRYLAAHTESPRLEEARSCRQEALDFDLAIAAGTAKMWRAFLRAWPDGRHRLDAEIRLRAAT